MVLLRNSGVNTQSTRAHCAAIHVKRPFAPQHPSDGVSLLHQAALRAVEGGAPPPELVNGEIDQCTGCVRAGDQLVLYGR